MGLDIEVGILADLVDNDEEGYAYFKEQFDAINRALHTAGLPPYNEPDEPEYEGLPWSCDTYGYSGLHYLRRIAAHLWLGHGLPEPGAQDASKDLVLQQCYERLDEPHNSSNFPHLVFHSDSEGFYLLLPFKSVIYTASELGIAGAMIGSAPMLMEERQRLAAVLDLPLDLDIEAEEVWSAAERQGESEIKWQRYGVESLTCLSLFRACEISVQSGAALVFV